MNEFNNVNSPHAPMTSCLDGGLGGRLTNSKTLLITSSNNEDSYLPDGSSLLSVSKILTSKLESQNGSSCISKQFFRVKFGCPLCSTIFPKDFEFVLQDQRLRLQKIQ